MRKLLLLVLIFIVQQIYGQITITSSEYASLFEPGKSWLILHADSLIGKSINIGEASGTSQVWTLPAGITYDTTYFSNLPPAGTPFENEFPTATHASYAAIEDEGLLLTTYLYFSITDAAVVSLGAGTEFSGFPVITQHFNDTVFVPPLTFGNQFTKTGTSQGTGDTVEVEMRVEVVDAFGTITMPHGVFDALRVNATVHTEKYVGEELVDSSTTHEMNFITKFGTVTFDMAESATSGEVPVTAINITVFGIPTDVKEDNSSVVKTFALDQNYPNPFNPVTVINYQVPGTNGSVPVQLKIFDMLGREVATLVNKEQNSGKYQVTFDAGNLSSGMYIYRLQAGDFIETKKMQLLK